MTATATPAQNPESAAPALPAAGSSFYTAMRLLPKERREAMYAVYAFCRAVDDVADDGGSRAVRQAELDAGGPISTRSTPAGPRRACATSWSPCAASA